MISRGDSRLVRPFSRGSKIALGLSLGGILFFPLSIAGIILAIVERRRIRRDNIRGDELHRTDVERAREARVGSSAPFVHESKKMLSWAIGIGIIIVLGSLLDIIIFIASMF